MLLNHIQDLSLRSLGAFYIILFILEASFSKIKVSIFISSNFLMNLLQAQSHYFHNFRFNRFIVLSIQVALIVIVFLNLFVLVLSHLNEEWFQFIQMIS